MSALPSAESLPNHWHTFKDKTLELPARIAAKYKAVMATTYYYVGAGTSSVPTGWNNALYWANSSGGTPGAGIPGSADTAIFDANSGYCTLDVAMNITALTLNTGFTKTLSFGSFGSTVSGTVTHTQGTLNTNSQTCTWGQLLSTGSTTRTLSLGSSAITVSLSGGTAWSFTGATNLTISSNTATVTFTGITSITTASLNWNGMSMVISPSSAGTVNFGTTSGTPTLTNLTYSPTAGVGNFLSMFCSLTISTSLTFTGAAAPNAILIESSTLGTARTITCNGTVSFTGQVDFQDITGAGTASWNLSTGLSGNVGGNSGITFATAGSYYYYATANGNYSTLANWYLGSGGTGGAGRVPLPQDTATFNSSSGSITVSFDTPRIGSWIATGFTGTSTLSGTTNCYGNVSLGGTYSGGIYSLSLLGRGLQTFTSNGVSSFAMSVAVGNTGSSTGGGTYTLQDSFSQASTNYLYLRYLNFNANNFNVTTGHIVNDAGTGTITMGSGTWTSLSTGTQACQFTAGTVVPGTSTIVLSGNGASTFAGNGKTFNNLTLSGGSSQVVTLTGANTFNNLTFSGKCTLTLPASTTTTISSLTDNSAGAGVTLNSSTGGTAGTLSCASGTVSVNGWTLQDNAATGGATFTDTNGTKGTNVTGWTMLMTRTLSDTSNSAASLARGFSGSRGLSDTSNSAGSLVGGNIRARSLSDTSNSADSLSDSGDVIRPLNDTSSSGDSVARASTISRSLSDNSLSGDALVRVTSFSRSLADTSNSSATLARVTVVVRLLADTSNSADSVVRSGTSARSLSVVSLNVDTLYRTSAYVRQLSDSSANVDALTRSTTTLRLVADYSLSGDSVVHTEVMSRSLSDSALSGDSVVAVYAPSTNVLPPGSVAVRERFGTAIVTPLDITALRGVL